jgi:Na+/proline symporter
MVSTKVTAGALAGAVVTLIVWIVNAATSVETPPEAAAALVVVVSFLLGYVVRETNPAPAPPPDV